MPGCKAADIKRLSQNPRCLLHGALHHDAGAVDTDGFPAILCEFVRSLGKAESFIMNALGLGELLKHANLIRDTSGKDVSDTVRAIEFDDSDFIFLSG